jgi:hypothetical protein
MGVMIPMNQKPKDRVEDSKKMAENNLEQAQPFSKQDLTQLVEVKGQGSAAKKRWKSRQRIVIRCGDVSHR